MDAANTSEWLGSAGTMDESFCTARKGSFVSGELAYNEVPSAVGYTTPSETQKKFASEAGVSNCCAFGNIRLRNCARIE